MFIIAFLILSTLCSCVMAQIGGPRFVLGDSVLLGQARYGYPIPRTYNSLNFGIPAAFNTFGGLNTLGGVRPLGGVVSPLGGVVNPLGGVNTLGGLGTNFNVLGASPVLNPAVNQLTGLTGAISPLAATNGLTGLTSTGLGAPVGLANTGLTGLGYNPYLGYGGYGTSGLNYPTVG